MKRAPQVTDHAVIRYLERVHGIDIDAYRAEIAEKVAVGVKLRASGVVIDGYRYVLADCHVTTVSPVKGDQRLPRMRADDEGDRA